MKFGLWLFVAAACSEPGVEVRMEFTSDELYAAPFPSEHLRRDDGGIDIGRFPNPKGVEVVGALKRVIAKSSRGFGTTSGVFFTLTGPPQIELPSLQDSLHPDSPVFLFEIEGGARVPITVEFREDGGPHGAANLLSVLPLQGAPLRANALHAVVVRSTLAGSSKSMVALADGDRPEGMSEAVFEDYEAALDALDRDEVAGLAVFRTDDPAREMTAISEAAREMKPAIDAPFAPAEIFDDYCVFHTTVAMPVFQTGDPPYAEEGGEIVFDAERPLYQRSERANFWLTIPRRPAPARGYPAVVFSRTGGGGERPLVDRGVHAIAHGEAIEPGSGPARTFARAGWAGLSIDGPHGGLRNITGGDEQLLIFNFANPIAMRDNIRQSAAELMLAEQLIGDVAITSSACPSASDSIRLDRDLVALMGHSMGATISPLATNLGGFAALILSGAGGSWIENVVHKQSPLQVKAIAELLLEYDGDELHEHDPVLSLLQWAGESADPPAYWQKLSPPHVLMFQGIVDTYILPPIANATSLAFGLSPAEPVLETSVSDLSALMGRTSVSLPSRENAVVQYAEDGIEDGHEIVFQREEPKRQIRCFLETLATGEALIVPGTSESCE
jgi:hypothetical protein